MSYDDGSISSCSSTSSIAPKDEDRFIGLDFLKGGRLINFPMVFSVVRTLGELEALGRKLPFSIRVLGVERDRRGMVVVSLRGLLDFSKPLAGD